MSVSETFSEYLQSWWEDESGNTTLDWIVLISAIMSMTLVVMLSISGGVNTFGNKAEASLATYEVGGNF